MSAAVVIFILMFLGLFIPIQVILARGWHSYALTQPGDLELTNRYKQVLQWVVLVGFAAWIVALVLVPAKFEVAIAGAATMTMLVTLIGLQLLARMGRISRAFFVIVRVALIPVVGGILILLVRVLR